jgi:GH35 family endo-1,4-beta-xylanase
MHRKHLVAGLAIVLLGALALFISRAALRARAFALTGEEDLSAQVNGLIQYALNLTYRHPDTQLYAAVEHAGENPFGINTFLHHEVEVAKREEQVRLIAEAGFTWIRQEFPWEDIEIHGRGDFVDRRNDPAGIDAWAKYDHIVDLAEQYDIEIIARLSNPPAWSRAAGDEMGTYAPPDDLADFANYVSAVVRRYRGRVRYYQVWNEPNIYPEWGEQAVDPEGYTALLCAAYRAIKAADPDAVVLSGALAPTAELSGRDLNDYLFLERMYQAGAGECFDILTMQGYGLWSGPTDQRRRPFIINYGRNEVIREMMVQHGDADKAIWISEMNWNAAPEDVEPRYGRVTLDQQARWAPLAYQRAQEEWPWVGVINFWYFKRASDDWLAARAPEAYFQMAAPDFTLMPVYESMKAYTAQPAVMYPGRHRASHWAVKADGWWSPWPDEYGEALQATIDQAALSFRFEGTSLQVIFGEDAAPVTLRCRVDNGPWQAIDQPGQEALLWRGAKGQHTVEIEADAGTVIDSFLVRDAPGALPGVTLGSLILLLIAALLAVRRPDSPADGDNSKPGS